MAWQRREGYRRERDQRQGVVKRGASTCEGRTKRDPSLCYSERFEERTRLLWITIRLCMCTRVSPDIAQKTFLSNHHKAEQNTPLCKSTRIQTEACKCQQMYVHRNRERSTAPHVNISSSCTCSVICFVEVRGINPLPVSSSRGVSRVHFTSCRPTPPPPCHSYTRTYRETSTDTAPTSTYDVIYLPPVYLHYNLNPLS